MKNLSKLDKQKPDELEQLKEKKIKTWRAPLFVFQEVLKFKTNRSSIEWQRQLITKSKKTSSSKNNKRTVKQFSRFFGAVLTFIVYWLNYFNFSNFKKILRAVEVAAYRWTYPAWGIFIKSMFHCEKASEFFGISTSDTVLSFLSAASLGLDQSIVWMSSKVWPRQVYISDRLKRSKP